MNHPAEKRIVKQKRPNVFLTLMLNDQETTLAAFDAGKLYVLS
jgi:hypothetical protein